MERLANDATNVDNIDLTELQRRHRMLAAAYRADRRRLEATEARMHEMQGALVTQESLQSAYAQLKHAHTQQALVMQRLQEQLGALLRAASSSKGEEERRRGEAEARVGKYRQTVKQQEVIIQKLEALLALAMKDVRRAKAQDPVLEALKGQLALSQAELERQREAGQAAPQHYYASEEQVKLLMRAERAERRAAAVEEEMTDMARQNAREIASLKLKLSERDAQLAGGFGSAANILNDFSLSGTYDVRQPGPPPHPSLGARRQSPRLDPLGHLGALSPGGGGEAVWG